MFSFDSRVRFSEVNESSKLDFASIINYFQDCSMFHSEEIGLGLRYFQENKRAWLLNTWQIHVVNFPCLYDKIKISTYPYSIKGFMGYRNFTITDENEKLCVIADSSWIYIDTKTSRPVRASLEETKSYGICERLDMNYTSGRISLPDNMQAETPFDILPSHIDSNHHVNNGQYVKLSENFLIKGFIFNQLRVEYRKAATIGDKIFPKIFRDQETSIVSLNNDSGKPYAIIEFSNTGGTHVTNR